MAIEDVRENLFFYLSRTPESLTWQEGLEGYSHTGEQSFYFHHYKNSGGFEIFIKILTSLINDPIYTV